MGNAEQNIVAEAIMRNVFINLITKNFGKYNSVFSVWQILSLCLSCFNKPLFTLIDEWSAQWLPLHQPLPLVKWSQVHGCDAKRLQHMKRPFLIICFLIAFEFNPNSNKLAVAEEGVAFKMDCGNAGIVTAKLRRRILDDNSFYWTSIYAPSLKLVKHGLWGRAGAYTFSIEDPDYGYYMGDQYMFIVKGRTYKCELIR